MREINARSSRKAKAAIVSEWKSQALAGFPTFSATVLTLRQRTRSGEGPALKQIGQLEWSRLSPTERLIDRPTQSID